MAKIGRPPRDPYHYFIVTVTDYNAGMQTVLMVKGRNMRDCNNAVEGYLRKLFSKVEARFIWANTTKEDFERLSFDRGQQTIYMLSTLKLGRGSIE